MSQWVELTIYLASLISDWIHYISYPFDMAEYSLI